MQNPVPIPGAEDGAMTEVALALAMGFFSILVLTLVSIGDGAEQVPAYTAVRLVETAPNDAGGETPDRDDIVVIFDGQRLLDTQLNPVDPAAIPADGTRRVVLAVDPSVRLMDIVAMRARLAATNLVIANLDSRWRAAVTAASERRDD